VNQFDCCGRSDGFRPPAALAVPREREIERSPVANTIQMIHDAGSAAAGTFADNAEVIQNASEDTRVDPEISA